MAYDELSPADDLDISNIPLSIRGKGIDLKALIDEHVSKAVAAHLASAIANSPAGNIASTTVQGAINELDSDKVSVSEVVTSATANKLLKLNGSGVLPANITGSSTSCTGNSATATTASSCSGNSATASNSTLLQGLNPAQVAALASMDAGHSFGGNGYQRFSNGLMLQWGIVEANGTFQTTAFPTPFSSVCLNVSVSTKVDTSANINFYPAILVGWNNANFTAGLRDGNNAWQIAWFAIGV